jgi:hypothetical protein
MAVKTIFTDDTARNELDTGQGPHLKEDSIHGDDLVINSNLPIFPWSLLAPRVKLGTPEPQSFHAYILGQAEAPLTVTSKGSENVEFANKTSKLNHVSGSMSTPTGQTINADIWLDSDGRIIKMLVPGQNVEVYQEGFERIAPPEPKPDAAPKTDKPEKP